MNNEISRKITSLTLMTIMLAGGLVAAAPSMMPAAHAANANLFVSAENSQFNNYMSGPQVIEVVVIDSNINDTDQAKGEPDVTVGGKELRMVQAVDGNWYGYFADRKMAQIADQTATSSPDGVGLDFGTFCTATSSGVGQGTGGFTFAAPQSVGVAYPRATTGGTQGTTALGTCTALPAGPLQNNVVREAKQINTNLANTGQINVNPAAWPFIQLYDLNPTGSVVIQYNKGGGVQTTTLTFDTVDNFASTSLDRSVYPPGTQIQATVTDLWLNIDPTDEDSWTFGTFGTTSTNYQVFDENGGAPGDVATNIGAISNANLASLMCEDNCRLFINPAVQGGPSVITLQDNSDTQITDGAADNSQIPTAWMTVGTNLAGFIPVTLTEQGPNSGIFATFDESDTSNLVMTNTAKRGTSAAFNYNDSPVTILVGLNFATIDIQPGDSEWNSGESIPLTLVDADANLNSRADEDLDLNDPNVKLLPALRTGKPNTLAALTSAVFSGGPATSFTVQKFSDRALITTGSSTTTITSGTTTLTLASGTMAQVFSSTPVNKSNFHGFALFNYDVRSLGNDGNIDNISSVDITLPGVPTITAQPLQGLVLLPPSFSGAAGAFTPTFTINCSAACDSIPAGTVLPIVADVFGFGFLNDGLESGERIANQIVRFELEETGDNTSTFIGSIEYTVINQLNILNPATYTGLTTISDEPTFIAIEDLTDEDSPRVTYLDLGADGVSTQVSDQQAAPTHSGIVSFSGETFKIADTVTVTLEDQDLNVDSDLIDIYTVVTLPSDANFDVVGDLTAINGGTSIPLSTGEQLGRVLDITFDDTLWTTPKATNACLASLLATGVTDTGLAASTFSLVETGPTSGTFVGDFQVPAFWCPPGALEAESITGLDMEVNYVDFRDASGETIEIGDGAGIRAYTGSVSLDRTVYPVPFGVPADFAFTQDTTPKTRSIFPIHQTGMNTVAGLQSGEFLVGGDLRAHIRVNDPDFDISASGEDEIAQAVAGTANVGPVKISVIRGSDKVILGFAGGPLAVDGPINVGNTLAGDGMIGIGELKITSTSGTFGAGPTAVTITQPGATTPGAAVFTDITGTLQTDELMVQAAATGMAPGTVTFTQGVATATGIWTDLNGDGNIDNMELSEVVTTSGTFVTNTPSGLPAITVTDASTALTATLFFTDKLGVVDPAVVDNTGELVLTTPPTGAGFVSGTVTLTPASCVTAGCFATGTFTDDPVARQFGPMNEIAPDAGIFEADITLRYTDGPANTLCPATLAYDPITGAPDTGANPVTDRFTRAPTTGNFCILQGDILQVEYTDPVDASGSPNTVTDSATFDLRNGVLQSDKSVYIIGSDMILTLIEPDLDLDNDQAETWDLDLIEWDSDAATLSMGDFGGDAAAFDPEPFNFRETGDSTGIFQIVIEIPQILDGDRLERGEEAQLEYTDWGPSGSDFVGDEDQDVDLTIFTSNFGATVELDQKVYTWTDKVYITIVAPDHNFDSNLIDDIGNTDFDPIKVSTRGDKLSNYKLVETGTDTGIFTGEVILTGFTHDADGRSDTGDANGNDVLSVSAHGQGPTDGYLPARDDDGLTVSFEFSEDETIVGSALIRWNIGETQWLEASYPASGTGVVRIIDPDMNLNPEAVDNFTVDVWSDSDAGGIDLTVTETNEATGIFEGTVFFTVTDESSGSRLRVAEGDTVTADYEDNTLPKPYTTADELDISATTLIGTIVPPLERAPISACRVVDAFTNTLSSVSVDQQAQITCDIANGQDRDQPFAYLIQVQDGNGVTVQLAWITGTLTPGQSFSPALSWIPAESGNYVATAFVWESIDNPTALSPTVDTPIKVQ